MKYKNYTVRQNAVFLNVTSGGINIYDWILKGWERLYDEYLWKINSKGSRWEFVPSISL
jgi:hypothetical protein